MKNMASSTIILISFFILTVSPCLKEASAENYNPYKQMYDEYKAARDLPPDYNPWTKKVKSQEKIIKSREEASSQSPKKTTSTKTETWQPAEEENFIPSYEEANDAENELVELKEEAPTPSPKIAATKPETLKKAYQSHSYTETPKIHQFDVSTEVSYIQYEEPDVMEENGTFYGLSFGYTYTGDDTATGVENVFNMFRAEVKTAFGQVEYESPISGTFDDNIDDLLGEARLLAGHHFSMNDWRVTPYFGVGYRYLNDDSSGMISSTGDSGYERESNYFYAPLGVTVAKQFKNDWQISINGEYDFFIEGKQKTHLSDASPLLPDITNTQKKGFGIRGFIEAKKSGEQYNFFIGPYVRYWKIEDSDLAVGVSGNIIVFGIEPENNSLEVGLRVGFEF